MRSILSLLLLSVGATASTETNWLDRVAPLMDDADRKIWRSLANESERDSFRQTFWSNKSITEADYLERLATVDVRYGSGKPGSGANTDQGRLFLANGAPNSIHRLPSSRVFVECEVWYYDSLPRAGYRSRLQFLFFKKNLAGDFRLYSPQLHTIRALLIPQPGTRLMFPVNDFISANDIRDRLKTNPAEEEVIEASLGVARGITGSGNAEILARVTSPAHMLRRDRDTLAERVESRFAPNTAQTQVRTIQFWADNHPVVDVQVRLQSACPLTLTLDDHGTAIERTSLPLTTQGAKSILVTQRFFLLPGEYRLLIECGVERSIAAIHVDADSSRPLTGEALEPNPGDVTIAVTPDPRSEAARETIRWQTARRAAANRPAAH